MAHIGLYEEAGPPTDIADRVNASFPNAFIKLIQQRKQLEIAEADKYVLRIFHFVDAEINIRDLLDGLKKIGFKLSTGIDGSGFPLLAWERAGGYYFGKTPKVFNIERILLKFIVLTDVGASQLVIDGKIKLKNDSPIKEFTPTGLKFENGSELPADVILFATG